MDYAANCASSPKWHKLPLLSVCIPAYNRPQGLLQAVHSIVAALPREHHEQVEIVITDDSPAPAVVADLLASWSGRWNYQHNLQRLGMVANWNASLAKASGSLFCFCTMTITSCPKGSPPFCTPSPSTAASLMSFFLGCIWWISSSVVCDDRCHGSRNGSPRRKLLVNCCGILHLCAFQLWFGGDRSSTRLAILTPPTLKPQIFING